MIAGETKGLIGVLKSLAIPLGQPFEPSLLEQSVAALASDTTISERDCLIRAGFAIRLKLATFQLNPKEVLRVVTDGIPVAVRSNEPNGERLWLVIQKRTGSKFEAAIIRAETGAIEARKLSNREVLKHLRISKNGMIPDLYCAEPWMSFENFMADKTAAAPTAGHGAGHHHAGHKSLSPLKRLINYLKMDLGDIFSLFIFAVTAGILGLATPLAVEWVVTSIGFGRYLQPLIVLAILLMTFLAFAGAMRVLQSIVVEVMQRRLMVRMVGDLSFRLPLIRQREWEGEHRPELLNRFFDIPTIQKATATLLLDGLAVILATIIGMALLAFYHPFLLGFDIILLICMTLVTYLLGRGATKTAKQESIVKYEIGHWLQDIATFSTTFRINGGSNLAMEKANHLTVNYLDARKRHFIRLLRQLIFAVALQTVASTALLGIGGWLVIKSQLTLGQLVASELVVAVIVGAFAKVGKSLETFYDLMASIDKVGHLFDLEIDTAMRPIQVGVGPAAVRWMHLACNHPAVHHSTDFGSKSIEPGKCVALVCEDTWESTAMLELIAGIREPSHGFSEIAGIDSREAIRVSNGSLVSIVLEVEIFHGSLLENITLRRASVGIQEARQALQSLGLLDRVLELPQGLETELQTGGFPLSKEERIRLTLARAIASEPRLLLIDRLVDLLPQASKKTVHECLLHPNRPWTMVVATNDPLLIERCEILSR